MDQTQYRICNLLVRHGRAEILQFFKPDSCIASTKVAIKVLTHFKINVRPQVMSLVGMNPIYRILFDAFGRHPTNDDADIAEAWLQKGAWMVAIDAATEVGHVVAIADDELMIDLSLDQAKRPNKHLLLEPSIFQLPHDWKYRQELAYEARGMRIIYVPENHNDTFRKSNDWRISSRTTPVVKKIIRIIERKL
jgi:hypothetical protein